MGNETKTIDAGTVFEASGNRITLQEPMEVTLTSTTDGKKVWATSKLSPMRPIPGDNAEEAVRNLVVTLSKDVTGEDGPEFDDPMGVAVANNIRGGLARVMNVQAISTLQ